MKRKLGGLAVMVMVGVMAGVPVVSAEDSAPNPSVTSQGAPSSDLPLADYQAFDQFAIAHPEIISDLSHHPELVGDPDFLSRHPDLRDFLGSHAELRGALINDPGDFIEPHSRRRSSGSAAHAPID